MDGGAKIAVDVVETVSHACEFSVGWVVPPSQAGTAHSLYVIGKQLRLGPPPLKPTVQCLYYVLDGIVYEAPSLHALLRTRVEKLGWLLSEAFDACWAAARGEEPATADLQPPATAEARYYRGDPAPGRDLPGPPAPLLRLTAPRRFCPLDG